MLRSIPVLIAGAIMLSAGVYQGYMSDRWGRHDTVAIANAVEALKKVPMTVGEWEGKDAEQTAENLAQLKVAQVAGVVQRDYTHRKTGVVVSIYLATGRSQKVCVHTPDKCYKAAGFKEEETAPYTMGYGDKKEGTFYVSRFRKDDADGVLFLRIFWGWNGDGDWVAPRYPKWTLNKYPVLFKLYAIRRITGQDENLKEDPINDFLKEFLPVVDPILYAPATPAAEPAPATKAA